MQSVKDQMISLIKTQPDDSSYEEILRELAFRKMIEEGLLDSENDRTLSNDEMGRRIRTWAK